MEKLNCKVKCIKTCHEDIMKEGVDYTFKNGIYIKPNGEQSSQYSSIKDFIRLNGKEFELIIMNEPKIYQVFTTDYELQCTIVADNLKDARNEAINIYEIDGHDYYIEELEIEGYEIKINEVNKNCVETLEEELPFDEVIYNNLMDNKNIKLKFTKGDL